MIASYSKPKNDFKPTASIHSLSARHLQQLLNTPPQIRPTRLKHQTQNLLIHRREYLPQRLLRRPSRPLMSPIDLLLHLRNIQARSRRARSRQQLSLLYSRVRPRMSGKDAEWSVAVRNARRWSRGCFFRIVPSACASAWPIRKNRTRSYARMSGTCRTRHPSHSWLIGRLNRAFLDARALISRRLRSRNGKPFLGPVQHLGKYPSDCVERLADGIACPLK